MIYRRDKDEDALFGAFSTEKQEAAAKEPAAKPDWADFVDQIVDEYGNIDCGDE